MISQNSYIRPEPLHSADHQELTPEQDSTLISTQSGKKFSKEASDWKWWHASVEGRLRCLAADGYLICVLSNQAGLALDATASKSKTPKADAEKVSKWKQKARAVFDQLDLPARLYAATDYDGYRKPRIGMWRQLIRDAFAGDEAAVDIEGSFFVGDAGGRTEGQSGLKKDFSCSDRYVETVWLAGSVLCLRDCTRDFAANAGIKFLTPEEFFLEEPARPFKRTFEPMAYLNSLTSVEKAPGQCLMIQHRYGGLTTCPTDSEPFTRRNDKDIVLFVGSPGAGKSTFYWTQLEPLGYARVNQDTLKTRDKCLSVADEYLSAGKSVAVDNTNADIDVRRHWLALAKKHDVPIRCVLFTASARLCEHNDAVRAFGGASGGRFNPERRTVLPKMAFAGFEKRYREPTVKEGFQDVVKVAFRFDGGEEERKIWGQYWVSST